MQRSSNATTRNARGPFATRRAAAARTTASRAIGRPVRVAFSWSDTSASSIAPVTTS